MTVSSKAVLAARNFVDTRCQHAAFVAGRGLMEDEIPPMSYTAGFNFIDTWQAVLSLHQLVQQH